MASTHRLHNESVVGAEARITQRAACPMWNKRATETRKELSWLAAGTCTFLCRDLAGNPFCRTVYGERRCLILTFNTIPANA